jgi:hypothetical protein
MPTEKPALRLIVLEHNPADSEPITKVVNDIVHLAPMSANEISAVEDEPVLIEWRGVACQASASAGVTAVTSRSLSTPSFLDGVIAKSRGRPECSAVAASRPLGLGRLRSRQRDVLS